ncbi:MAG: hypothetical protein SF339_23265 [Blastocatellia bacterium]|nr:hypothetical protein [Blastocatellia bacterium]
MKQILCLTLLLFMALPVLGQNGQNGLPARACRMASHYDRLADATTIHCDDLIPRGEAPAGLSVGINHSYRGKSPNETAKFRLHLSSNRGGVTRHSPPLFQGNETLYLIADSSTLELTVKDYNNTFFELIRSTAEEAQAEIRPEDLQTVLAAQRLEGRWGAASFTFSPKALATLKEFIARRLVPEEGR